MGLPAESEQLENNLLKSAPGCLHFTIFYQTYLVHEGSSRCVSPNNCQPNLVRLKEHWFQFRSRCPTLQPARDNLLYEPLLFQFPFILFLALQMQIWSSFSNYCWTGKLCCIDLFIKNWIKFLIWMQLLN